MAEAGPHAAASNVHARLWWLPANGHGNGLDDDSWVAMLDVATADVADELLADLATVGVAAYAAPLPARARGSVRIWVGAHGHGIAEDRLIAVLPSVIRERGEVVL